MPKIPYWLTINSDFEEKLSDSECFSYFETNSVSNGDSPLVEHGKRFVEMLYNMGCPTHDKIWIFVKEPLDNKLSHHVGTLFALLSRVKSDNALSEHGTVSLDGSGAFIDRQPPHPDIKDNVYTVRPFVPGEADATFLLARNIVERSLFNDYFHQFSYLKELRCTDPFLGYLGLWSFIEIEWADDPKKTDMNKSLKSLLEGAFHNQPENKRKFNKRLKYISSQVGESVGEYSIRNLLAHGKCRKVSSDWNEEMNIEFHAIHDDLFKIVLAGIEKKIRDNIRD
ncbi:hypothetical protein HMF8227_00501 [Saliniradius amylolyticus]|uniref:Apea-like HEPN domain-containing protein n=1 Tax=Saliniradius amylolyticus TaxID=2183582 RepID=A0A2S2E1U3_9ALTE|nr:hypothetical protein [Saliniradius amylolyticus]AWL10997.1 hypothetical protein HMF8227_00501 [Saliniradius amylolyticus]